MHLVEEMQFTTAHCNSLTLSDVLYDYPSKNRIGLKLYGLLVNCSFTVASLFHFFCSV